MESDMGQAGFTLTEVMIALLVLMISIIGVFTIATQSARLVRGMREETRASQGAEIELEKLRSWRWSAVAAMGSSWTNIPVDANSPVAMLPSGQVAMNFYAMTPDSSRVTVHVRWRPTDTSGAMVWKTNSVVTIFTANGI